MVHFWSKLHLVILWDSIATILPQDFTSIFINEISLSCHDCEIISQNNVKVVYSYFLKHSG